MQTKRNKVKTIIISCIAVLLVLACVLAFLPSFYEFSYTKNQSTKTLYQLCVISKYWRRSDLIVNYYPLLLTENNELSSEECDDLWRTLLDASVKRNDSSYLKNLKDAYLQCSSAPVAVGICVNSIAEFYEKTKDEDFCKNAYSELREISPDAAYEFILFQQEHSFFLLTCNDLSYAAVVNKDRDKLYDEYIHWKDAQVAE